MKDKFNSLFDQIDDAVTRLTEIENEADDKNATVIEYETAKGEKIVVRQCGENSINIAHIDTLVIGGRQVNEQLDE